MPSWKEKEKRRREKSTGKQEPELSNEIKVLQKMSDYIGGLKTLRMSLDEIKEVVTKSDKVVQERIHQTYMMKRPNKLSIKSTGTKVDKQFTFDGITVAIKDYKTGSDVNVDIPGTVDNLIQNIYEKRDYVVPVADLLYSDIFSSINSNITKAGYKGIVVMDGKKCHYILCMSGSVRWQIWIKSEGRPIPLRIIIDYPGKSSVKRYAAKITDLRSAGKLADDLFVAPEKTDIDKK
jgi:hypothetical protein